MLLASTAYAATTRYENYEPSIVYGGTGPWLTWSNPGQSGTPPDCTYASTTDSTVTFPFNGTGIDWIAVMATNQGYAEVWVDSEAPETVDLYAGSVLFQQVIWSKSGLSNGPHTLNIRVLGTWNPLATAGNVSVDAFDVHVDPPAVSTPASSPWSLALLATAGCAGLGAVATVRKRAST